MSQSYIGEIRMFGGNFAPFNWAFCDGSMISIANNSALFNLIGTTYGGNGQTNFALPNLLGRVPIHAGQGSTQTYVVGQTGGLEKVTLIANDMPTHSHALLASTNAANASLPTGNVLANTVNTFPYFRGSANESLNSGSVTQIGGSESHENMMPFLCVNFIIALYGVYPPQS
jgi:microcystin-dependent protein